ncbi:MAG: PorT family protein [Draconibacterium sp.]|nr:PorT family protein [Draconibacterium sp.]
MTTFALILFSLFALAQSNEKNLAKKLSIGVSFSPDYSYRRLYSSDDNIFVDIRNKEGSPRFGFTTGIITSYKINNRFELESGIQFSDKGDKYGFVLDDLILPGDPFNERDDPSIPEKFTSEYHFYCVGIPVKINYYFLRKNFGLFISMGVSADYLIDAKIKNKSEFKDRTEKNSTTINNEDFNKLNIVGLTGFGIDYIITPRIKFQLEPVFRYSFTPIDDTPLKGYLYSFGADFTLFFH